MMVTRMTADVPAPTFRIGVMETLPCLSTLVLKMGDAATSNLVPAGTLPLSVAVAVWPWGTAMSS